MPGGGGQAQASAGKGGTGRLPSFPDGAPGGSVEAIGGDAGMATIVNPPREEVPPAPGGTASFAVGTGGAGANGCPDNAGGEGGRGGAAHGRGGKGSFASLPSVPDGAPGDAILATEVLWGRGGMLYYAGRGRAGVADVVAACEALEAMPLEVTRDLNPTAAWLADALPESAPVDTAGEETAAVLLHAAGLHFRRCAEPWLCASTGQPGPAVALGERYVAALAEAPVTKAGIRSTAAFAYHGLAIAHAALGRPDEALEAEPPP